MTHTVYHSRLAFVQINEATELCVAGAEFVILAFRSQQHQGMRSGFNFYAQRPRPLQ
jgi:hypothetical protein